MKRHRLVELLVVVALAATACASAGCGRRFIGSLPALDGGGASDGAEHMDGGSEPASDGDARDGDANDGDARDGDANDGDARDGDANDGDARDGDARDGNTSDGNTSDGNTSDGDGASSGGGGGGHDARADGAPDAQASPVDGTIAGRVLMDGSVAGRPVVGAGVAGVVVTLAGPAARAAITDANGAYQFVALPRGTYTVSVSKTGATFTAAEARVTVAPPDGGATDGGATDGGATSAGLSAYQPFACAAPCGAGPTIDPDRELYIETTGVLAGPRARNDVNGPWSFRRLMSALAFGVSPNAFANIWIDNLAASGRDVGRLRQQWPTVDEDGQAVPDLAYAPFQLLAIVNRIDLHASGNGELRFIYGIYDGVPGVPQFNPQGRTFTISVGFHLPSTAANPDRPSWARQIHALGAIPATDEAAYAAALQALTDQFVRPDVYVPSAANPSGTSFASLRVSEAFGTGGPWQLREFRLLPDSRTGKIDLVLGPVPQTPDSSRNGQAGPLPDFVNANATLVQAGLARLPDELLGMWSALPTAPSPLRWTLPGVADDVRHAFAGQTCVGCHLTETPTGGVGTFHVDPTGGPRAGNYSGLVLVQELPRRTAFMQNQLTCAAAPATCAAGGEEMMGR